MGFRRSMWIASASALALTAFAAPAFAQEAGNEVEEVVVTGIRASLQQSIQSKRNADAVVEVITAEDVGKFPDKNVAESLQRVTGVSIQRDFGEGERIAIRGTEPALNLTLLNGHGVATADWFILDQLDASRSFNYLMLPSEIVGRVEVFKSPQADIEEGGIGGTVDVRTRRPLDLDPFTVSASAQMAYSERADKWDPQLSGMISWSNDADTFGLMVGLLSQKRQLRRDGVEVLGYATADFGGAIGEVDYPNLIGSSFFQQERDRKGANFAVQFRPNDQLDVNLTGLYSHMDADNFNQNYMAWITNKVGAGSALSGTEVVDDTLVKGTFANDVGYGAVFDAIDRLASTETRSLDLDVKFQPNDLWTLHGQIGYTDAYGETEEQFFWETVAQTGVSFDLTQGVPQVSFADIDPTDAAALDELGWAAFDNILNNDSEFYARGDVERVVDFGPFVAVKAGLKYTKHERETFHMVGRYPTLYPWAGGTCGTPPHACGLADAAGDLTPSDYLDGIAGPGVLSAYRQVDRNALRALIRGRPLTPWSPTLAPGTDFSEMYPNDSYTITEKALGGYVMGEFEGDGFRGNLGVRVVQTDQTSAGWAVGAGGGAPNAFGDITPVSFDKSYVDILPSANIVFDLTDDLLLRFAAAKVMARPEFAKIAPQVSLTPSIFTGIGGNPDLDPFRASQFDASVEWYYAPESLLAVSFFYKDIQSYIRNDSFIERHTVELAIAPPVSQGCTSLGAGQYDCPFLIDRPGNGEGGRNQGVEVNWQQPVWNGFGFQANYTYSDAEALGGQPIPGNSEHVLNLVGYYENDRVSARLAYNYRSEYFMEVDRGAELNSTATKSLDASVSVNLMDNLALTFDAQNLTDETLEWFSGTESRPRAFYKNGRVFYFGARAKF